MVTEHLIRYQFACQFAAKKMVADIGCGVGYGCLTLAKGGAKKVIGIDNSQEAIEYARCHYHDKTIDYLVRDATKTGLPDNSQDLVVAFETIEHLAKPRLFLKEVKRILSPAGQFIISTPNKAMVLSENPFHQREYSLAKFSSLLSGFKNIKLYGQRPVNPQLIKLLQIIQPRVPVFLQRLLTYRPWESVAIHPLDSFSQTNYHTFIAVCR